MKHHMERLRKGNQEIYQEERERHAEKLQWMEQRVQAQQDTRRDTQQREELQKWLDQIANSVDASEPAKQQTQGG